MDILLQFYLPPLLSWMPICPILSLSFTPLISTYLQQAFLTMRFMSFSFFDRANSLQNSEDLVRICSNVYSSGMSSIFWPPPTSVVNMKLYSNLLVTLFCDATSSSPLYALHLIFNFWPHTMHSSPTSYLHSLQMKCPHFSKLGGSSLWKTPEQLGQFVKRFKSVRMEGLTPSSSMTFLQRLSVIDAKKYELQVLDNISKISIQSQSKLNLILIGSQSKLNPNKYQYLYSKSMQNLTKRRLENEIKEIKENPSLNWRIVVNEQDLYHWKVFINVDSTSPFYGREFKLYVDFSEEYPKEPPKFKLADPELFFHPNIDPFSGQICSKALNVKSISQKVRDRIDALVVLLSNPNPNSPLNREAGQICNQNQRKYYRKALMIFRGKEKLQNAKKPALLIERQQMPARIRELMQRRQPTIQERPRQP